MSEKGLYPAKNLERDQERLSPAAYAEFENLVKSKDSPWYVNPRGRPIYMDDPDRPGWRIYNGPNNKKIYVNEYGWVYGEDPENPETRMRVEPLTMEGVTYRLIREHAERTGGNQRYFDDKIAQPHSMTERLGHNTKEYPRRGSFVQNILEDPVSIQGVKLTPEPYSEKLKRNLRRAADGVVGVKQYFSDAVDSAYEKVKDDFE